MMLDSNGPERLARGLTDTTQQQQRQADIQVNTTL
jgi:hypothetical protein